MGGVRETIDGLTPTQRGTLGVLAALVLVAAMTLIVVLAASDDDEPAAASPTSVATTASTIAPSTSSTTGTSVTTTSSVTTTTAATTTTSSPSTTTTIAPERVLVLRPDGLGELSFGDPADEVFAELVAILGLPDEDTGWVDQFENYGTCLGEEVRFARWRSLNVFFTDGPSDWAPAETRHLAAYAHSEFWGPDVLDLVSVDGLELGTPVGDVRALYGDEAVTDDPVFGALWVWDPPGAAYQWGEVTGVTPEDTVTSISGSFACGE